jgi:hypothetical protein
MSDDTSTLPASARIPSTKQLLFLRYFTAILIDLAVLNLFDEYWEHVVIDSFTISLIAALLLQVLLKITLALEHRAHAQDIVQHDWPQIARLSMRLEKTVR